MDIEKLIKQLRTESLYADKASLEIMDLCMESATALYTLHAENEKLRAELDEKEKYYDQMIDALAATNSTELEQVKRERDAAVEDLHKLCHAWKWDGQKED